MKHLSVFLLLLCVHSLLFAQPGRVDPTFIPATSQFSGINLITVQPDGKILTYGFDYASRGEGLILVRYLSDGSLDSSFRSSYFDPRSVISKKLLVQNDGKILLMAEGPNGPGIRRLNPDGSRDSSFSDELSELATPQNTIALTPDQKILTAFFAVAYDGAGNAIFSNKVARLLPSGAIDTSFLQIPFEGDILEIRVQPDGKILIGGAFKVPGGATQPGIARLNADGSPDTSFHPGAGVGDNHKITSIVAQPDGKIVIAGDFTSYDGIARNQIARLNADGSLDPSFNPGAGADGTLVTVAVQADGKVLLQGYFTTFNGVPRRNLARLNSDGSLDTGFDAGIPADDGLNTLTLQPDGRILAGGIFASANGMRFARVLRLLPNGSRDTSFNTGFVALPIDRIFAQADGKVLVQGGDGGQLFRFNADGSFDSTFTPAVREGMTSIVPLPDGKLLLAGFYNVNLPARIARLNANGSLDTSFHPALPAGYQVDGLAVEANGNILLHAFNANTGAFFRIHPDGSAAAPFAPVLPADFSFGRLIVQPDGNVLIWGLSNSGPYFARVRPDGSSITPFQPVFPAGITLQQVAVQASGKVLFRGYQAPGPIFHLFRLNADGSSDTAFNALVGTFQVFAFAVQPDDKILVSSQQAGPFFAPGRFFRLNADGTRDNNFVEGLILGASYGRINTISLDSSGTIIVGGSFISYNGSPRINLARLFGNGSVATSVGYPGTPYCRDTGIVQPVISGMPGGSFSATPSGSGIDAATGAINLATAQAGTYTVTYSFSGGSAGTQVTIRPDNFVAAQANRVFCAGASVSSIAFNGLPGLSYSWTNSNAAIGLPASGTGNLPAFTAQNGGTTPLFANIRVQPAGGSGCVISAMTFRITVNPSPTVAAVSNQSLCAGESSSAVTFSGSLPGTVYSWTNNNTSIGLNAAGTGDIPAFTVRNPSGTPQVATITVTPSASQCPGVPQTFTLSVSPSAGSISYPQAAYCQGGWAYAQRTGSGNGLFSATPSGLVMDAQSGAVNLALSQAGTYTVTYSVAASGSCNATATTQLSINPRATVNPVPNTTFCAGQTTTAIAFSGTAGSYAWTNDNPAIGLPASGTGNLPSFMAAATGTATIRVVPQGGAGTCTGKAMVFRIRVTDCTVSGGIGPDSAAGTLRGAYIILSPNPVRRHLTVRCQGYSGPLMVSLVSPAGAVMKTPLQLLGNKGTLDLGGLAAGLYIVQLTDPASGVSIQRSLIKLQ